MDERDILIKQALQKWATMNIISYILIIMLGIIAYYKGIANTAIIILSALNVLFYYWISRRLKQNNEKGDEKTWDSSETYGTESEGRSEQERQDKK